MSGKDQVLPQKPVRLGSGVWTSHSGVLPRVWLLLFTFRPGRCRPWGGAWEGAGGQAGELEKGEEESSEPWSAFSDGCLAQSTREKLLTPSPNALIHLQENWKRLSHFSP